MRGRHKGRVQQRLQRGGVLCAALAAIVFYQAGCSVKEIPALPDEEIAADVQIRNLRIGCLESERYYFYTDQLASIADTLGKQGWINWGKPDGGKASAADADEGMVCAGENDTSQVWADICASGGRKGFDFLEDAYYNFAEMEDAKKAELIARRDIDLLLVFGTAAGKWLTDHSPEVSYDYMVFGSADPVTAGIVPDKNGKFSSNSFAHVDPSRTGRQIDMAYRLFHFTDIGVVYEDSAAAYSYSGIRQLEERSKKYGFEIHALHVEEPKNAGDYERYYKDLKTAYEKLLFRIDVLYITTGQIEDKMLPWLLEDVHKAGVLTVAETRESQVQYGALVHITMSDPRQEGDFAAHTLIEYLHGTPIDQLSQVYEITPKIVFNYDTARLLGADIPMTTYLIADTIYSGNPGAALLEEKQAEEKQSYESVTEKAPEEKEEDSGNTGE